MKPLMLLRKMFLGGVWYVGLRRIGNTPTRYVQVKTPKGQWIADPFLYETAGRTYLFVEQYFTEKQRAGIGVYEIINGEAVNNRIIIDNPYHMSYPCVFNCNGKHYMIPESSANNTIDLYEASHFPYEWKRVKSLISGEIYVDSTVYKHGDKYYLISYKKDTKGWHLVLFLLDMDKFVLNQVSEKIYDNNVGRPAGFLYMDKDLLIRPAQDCSRKYGESIILYKVNELEESGYSEEKFSIIDAQHSLFERNIDRVHTYNKTNEYEVIDVFKERIDLMHGIKIFRRAYLKH